MHTTESIVRRLATDASEAAGNAIANAHIAFLEGAFTLDHKIARLRAAQACRAEAFTHAAYVPVYAATCPSDLGGVRQLTRDAAAFERRAAHMEALYHAAYMCPSLPPQWTTA